MPESIRSISKLYFAPGREDDRSSPLLLAFARELLTALR